MSGPISQHRSACYQQAEMAMVAAQAKLDEARLLLIHLGRFERRTAKRSHGMEKSLAIQNAQNLLKMESNLDEAIESITLRHGRAAWGEPPLIYNIAAR